MGEPGTPAFVVRGQRTEIRCTTPGCRKLLVSQDVGTELLRGRILMKCPRCKAEYAITPAQRFAA